MTAATVDGAVDGRWIAVDESGWDGEQLMGRAQRYLTIGSVAVDDQQAAAIVAEIRQKARVQQSAELKFKSFKDNPQRWPFLRELWEPGGVLDRRCEVYLVDKAYAAVAKLIDLLVEERAYAQGRDIYSTSEAVAMARTLYAEGPRALGPQGFSDLVSAFVDLASSRGRTNPGPATTALFDQVEKAWTASTRRKVTDILYEVRQCQPYAAEIHIDSPMGHLEMLTPAIAALTRHWARSLGTVSVLADEQTALTDEVFDQVLGQLRRPSGLPVRLLPPRADVTALVRGSSHQHPSIQLADLLAGAAGAAMRRVDGEDLPATNGLWPSILPLIHPNSLLPVEDIAAFCAGIR